LTHREFISQIADNIKITKKVASKFSSDLIDIINSSMNKNNELEIPGFGTFFKKPDGKISFKPDEQFINELNKK